MPPSLLLEVGPRECRLQGAAGTTDVQAVEGAGEAEALAEAAAALAARLPRGARLDVRVASPLARIMVLPWSEAITGEARWQTFAQARFEQTYGDEGDRWEIRVARDLPGRDRIAVAWPAPLARALSGVRALRSARVGLLEHLAVLLHHMPAFTGCLAEIGEEGAAMVLVVSGEVRRARWRRHEDDASLAATLRSEWASVGAHGAAALALAPPAPPPASERAATVSALAEALGTTEVFTLPDLGAGPVA